LNIFERSRMLKDIQKVMFSVTGVVRNVLILNDYDNFAINRQISM